MSRNIVNACVYKLLSLRKSGSFSVFLDPNGEKCNRFCQKKKTISLTKETPKLRKHPCYGRL